VDPEEGLFDQERMLELEEEIAREQNPDRVRRLQRELDETRQ
jgi:hypothetical protein